MDPVDQWEPISKESMKTDSLGKEMAASLKLVEAAVKNRENSKRLAQLTSAQAYTPYAKNWVAMAVKRAIWEALDSGHTFVAFPSDAKTVARIEGHEGSAPNPGIVKHYEKEIPKELQKIIKQYGGELHIGNIHRDMNDAGSQGGIRMTDEYNAALRKDEASRIVGYDFSKVIDVIKSKGFRLPAIALGAAVLNPEQQE